MTTKVKSIEEEYQKLTQEEQILLRPDTNLGSIIEQEKAIWAVKDINDLQNIKIEKQLLTFKPAFIKLFDEILTNASDHYHRGGGVKNIKVTIDKDFTINVWNDGKGIPVVKHKEHNMWLPEMLLGHLNSGSNYDDSEQRYGAGRNGLGSSLVSLFSSKFIIDCADGTNSYYQELGENLQKRGTPKIKSSSKSYTSVTYTADFNRLPITGLEEATLKIFLKRVIDVAVYNPKVKVWFNDTLIQIDNIKDWATMHLNPEDELFVENINDKWQIALAESKGEGFDHCSIVNGNTTWQGGTHVDYIMNQIVKRLTADLTRGNKGIKIRSSDIKNKFHLFLVSKIANPSFDSQTKENMSLKIEDSFELSDGLYKKLMKSQIIENILAWVQMKEQMELNKLNKKAAGKTLRIDKLVDAHKAGTSEGFKCALFLAEGDSAKGSTVTGLSVVGRDYYGVFPLRGKPLNVRDAKISKITENEEIQKIFQIVGLVPGKKYTSVAELRYGKVIFMTDADADGTNIKGLLINMIHQFWPELLELGFCYEFVTPIIIAKKGKEAKEYYDLLQYEQDKEKGKIDGWYAKYYKGLGTITAELMKTFFSKLDRHLIRFDYLPKRDNDKIDMLFKKDRVQDRKDWLLTYKGEVIPNKFGKDNHINDFIDNEHIQYSNYDNIRSLPNTIDGFKPTQRKIMFGAFKTLGTTEKEEMKVEQFASYVGNHTHYMHGGASMEGAIVGMAQDFVGTNNINFLWPQGNFANRLNPNASAASRYIHTFLNPLTKYVFRKEDESILNWNKFEDTFIEPEFYLPIIPTILLNGVEGIGTGWSTSVPKFSPMDLIKVIKKKIEKSDLKYKIHPDYNKFKGEIEFNSEKNAYISKGVYQKSKKGILITELPIDVWTEAYVIFLDRLCDEKKIKNYIDNSTDNDIHIEVILQDDTKSTEIESLLKLSSSISMNNMHSFIGTKIVKWESAEQLLNTWFDIRLDFYNKRKAAWLKALEDKVTKNNYILTFIKFVIEGDVVVNNRKKDAVVKDLIDMEFAKMNDSFDYLLNIPIYHFTKEKYEEIKQLVKDLKDEYKIYKSLQPGDIWISDLSELEQALKKAGY